MPIKVLVSTDDETGWATRSITIDCRERLTAEDVVLAREHIAYTLRDRRVDLDGVEHDLRTGRWKTKYADRLLGAIERLRVLWEVTPPPVVTITVVSIGLGMLLAEADAKDHWPSLLERREFRTKQRRRSIAGVATKADTTARRDEHLRAVVRAYQVQHPTHSLRRMARHFRRTHFPGKSADAIYMAIARVLKK